MAESPILNGWKEIGNYLNYSPEKASRIATLPVFRTKGMVLSHIKLIEDWKYKQEILSMDLPPKEKRKLLAEYEDKKEEILKPFGVEYFQLSKPKKSEFIQRSDKKYLEWRRICLERDGFKCQQCGSDEKLHVHHKALFAKYKKIRIEIDNGITLCKVCHKSVHKGVIILGR